MRVGIVIRIDGRTIRLQVERIYLSEQIERFEIKAKNKTLTIQSNRPLLGGKGIKCTAAEKKGRRLECFIFCIYKKTIFL